MLKDYLKRAAHFLRCPLLYFFCIFCTQCLAQKISNNFHEKLHLRDVLFVRTHISFSALANTNQGSFIHKESGKYELKSSSKIGYEGGINIISNFSDYYGLLTGLHININPYNYNYSVPAKDLRLPNSWGNIYQDNFTFYDFVSVAFPIWIERRFFIREQYIINLVAGINIKYAPAFDGGFISEISTDSTSAEKVFSLELSNGKSERGKIWINENAGVGVSKILPNGNLITLTLIANWSPTYPAKGHYEFYTTNPSSGEYNIRGNYIGVEASYTFTKARKVLRQANEGE